jgi:ATP-dependent DNA helicase RecQ
MSCILRTGQRFGMAYIIDILLGSRQKRIVDNGHNKLSTWGIGTELGREDWFELGNDLIEEGYIEKTEDYGVLSLTASGRNLLAARQTVFLPVLFSGNEKPLQLIKTGFRLRKKTQAVIDENDREAVRIAAELRRWRQKQAEEENVPPYVIFGDKTLADIACVKPDCRETLLTVYGIGEVKAEKFGSAIIRIVKN